MLGLPDELLFHILEFCDIKSLVLFGETCERARSFVLGENISRTIGDKFVRVDGFVQEFFRCADLEWSRTFFRGELVWFWEDNGRESIMGKYKNGRRHGKWFGHCEWGDYRVCTLYCRGKELRKETKDRDGILKIEVKMGEGKRSPIFRGYYETTFSRYEGQTFLCKGKEYPIFQRKQTGTLKRPEKIGYPVFSPCCKEHRGDIPESLFGERRVSRRRRGPRKSRHKNIL
ncbi:F-box containing protein [Marseillevirus Shanghai 1]|nr:F-box containing protein [Marseillevirus Shanghai 1]